MDAFVILDSISASVIFPNCGHLVYSNALPPKKDAYIFSEIVEIVTMGLSLCGRPILLIGTLSKTTITAVKTPVKKSICVLSNFIVSIWTHSICQMQATFTGVEFLRILFRFKKRKENSSSYVHVPHKTSN